jgi:hypothetical protein
VLMFRSKRTDKIKYIGLNESFKDWKDSQPEIESMGYRLDSVRKVIAKSKPGTWAHTHWTQIESVVFRKWSMMICLQQSGLRQVGPDRSFKIAYDWWEASDEIKSLIPVPNFMNDWFNHSDLAHSWENAKEQKLQKARQGLA